MNVNRTKPETAETVTRSPFTELGLPLPLVRAVIDEKYEVPSPIQREVIPLALGGRDVIACAQTGTGKTAGFVLPILAHLADRTGTGIRGLILTPTRELAAQIDERIAAYGRYLRIRHAVIYGGVSQHRQEVALRRAPDLIVATPGRLLDLIDQRLVNLSGITHFVLDEADRMLDMGFVHDVRRVVARLPHTRQTLFFSATMAPAVETLARSMLKDPARVSIMPEVTTAEGVDQAVIHVDKHDKRFALESLLRDENITRALVFVRTKHGADRLAKQLSAQGFNAAAIHGNKAQNARERALAGFRSGETRVLIATDLAARGIDVVDISLVVNFDLPNVPESYVHRIGRTGRAGAMGRAVSFCSHEERSLLADIEKFVRRKLPVIASGARGRPSVAPSTAREAPSHSAAPTPEMPKKEARPQSGPAPSNSPSSNSPSTPSNQPRRTRSFRPRRRY